MFYGGGGSRGGDRDGPKGRLERFDQMSKQQQLIEQKKREIEAKLQAERHKKAMESILGKQETSNAAGAVNSSAKSGLSVAANKSSSPVVKLEHGDREAQSGKPAAAPGIVFANDGSFMEQFRKLQQQKKLEEQKAQMKTKLKQEPEDLNEYGATGVKKPLIKIMNVVQQPRKSSSPPISSEQPERRFEANKSIVPPSNTYGAVPPPPPPPRQEYTTLVRQQERNIPTTVPFNTHQFAGGYNNVPPPPPPPPPPPYPPQNQKRQGQGPAGFPSIIVKNFAATVADKGDQHETSASLTNNPLLWFLNRPDSEEYRLYRDLVVNLRTEKSDSSGQSFNLTPATAVDLHEQSRPESYTEVGRVPTLDSTTVSSVIKREAEDEDMQYNAKKRRSRWGPQDDNVPPPAVALNFVEGISSSLVSPSYQNPNIGISPNIKPLPQVAFSQSSVWTGSASEPILKIESPSFEGLNIPGVSAADLKGPSPFLNIATRTNPQLLEYARQSYGTIQLDEEQWKQCEEAYKMNLLFQDIARKKAKDEKLSQMGKFKYEYDSDEEIDSQGTWEHKKRMQEMEKTQQWANELTAQAKGKHHIGDFLPPEELQKFMDKYKAVKDGKQMTQSAYEDFKIAQDNVGFKLLQKMGWVDGQGLGATSQGITAPIDKGTSGSEKHGLGLERPDEMGEDDDEYSAYRKRMMLAYRFRPNPLNNPRRAYY